MLLLASCVGLAWSWSTRTVGGVRTRSAPAVAAAAAGLAADAAMAADATDAAEYLWRGEVPLPGAECQERLVGASPGVALRVLRWSPTDSAAAGRRPLVFVAGWGSVFEGWRPLLTTWASRRPIIYIETREKKSAEFDFRPNVADFAMARHADDIAAVLAAIGVAPSTVDWFSSSLGATLLLDGFQRGTLDGRASVMLAPNPAFNFPLWARYVLRLPLPRRVYARLQPLGMWAVRRKTKEPAQRARYERSLAAQDLERLVLSMKANLQYTLPAACDAVAMPCAVLAASSDTLHGMEQVASVVERLPNATLIEVPSNQYAHEADVLADVEPFYEAVG